MGWTRHARAGVTLVVVASVVANYAVHRHFQNQSRKPNVSQRDDLQEFAPSFRSETPATPLPSDLVSSRIPRRLDEVGRLRHRGAILPALQSDDQSDPPATHGDLNPVPVPSDSSSPNESEARAAREILSPGADAVRSVIEKELSGCSREERDIWFEELKTLPAGVVRDLLQVRKQLRTLPKIVRRPETPIEPAPSRQMAEIPAEPVSQSRRLVVTQWSPSLESLDQAVTISRHNLLNSMTPGYKRFRVMLIDTYGSHWPQQQDPAEESPTEQPSIIPVEGARLAVALLDLEQGALQKTNRTLDLAIDGEGFFVAVLKERVVYTRCGAVALDSQRRLSLIASDCNAILQPEVTIPTDAREIQISAEGLVTVLRKLGTDPEPVGQLQLARFSSPARLRPLGATLLVPTLGSGVAEIDRPIEGGRGIIHQGCLEQSNVDLESEQAELNRWLSLTKSLPTISRPVTARGDDPASR